MNKRIVILGAGESGVGAAILAKMKGFDVFVSDYGEIKQEYKDMLISHNISFEEKKHSDDLIQSAGEIIKSPGISDKTPVIQAIKAKGIKMVSDIEFAGRYTKAKKICITGSNGKTTTTLLIYHVMKNSGLNVGLAGNVGKSFALQVAENKFDYYVIELSSFQLDYMFDFKADIAILMNITPDHLDRYNYEFQNYIDSKFRIVQNQTLQDYFIYCDDDEVIKSEILKRDINATMLPFTIKNELEQGAFLNQEKLIFKLNNTEFTMNSNEITIKGKHNTYNSMAAGIASKLNDIRDEMIRERFQDFQGVEHRLENFIKVKGIQFINDSKATNINSVWYALDSMKSNNVIWIVGGQDKGNDYEELMELVKEKVKVIVCLGADNTKIMNAFEGVKEVFDTHNIDDAVKTAYFMASDGDVVLLSPACASFDLFKNYEDRGRKFKEAVRNL